MAKQDLTYRPKTLSSDFAAGIPSRLAVILSTPQWEIEGLGDESPHGYERIAKEIDALEDPFPLLRQALAKPGLDEGSMFAMGSTLGKISPRYQACILDKDYEHEFRGGVLNGSDSVDPDMASPILATCLKEKNWRDTIYFVGVITPNDKHFEYALSAAQSARSKGITDISLSRFAYDNYPKFLSLAKDIALIKELIELAEENEAGRVIDAAMFALLSTIDDKGLSNQINSLGRELVIMSLSMPDSSNMARLERSKILNKIDPTNEEKIS